MDSKYKLLNKFLKQTICLLLIFIMVIGYCQATFAAVVDNLENDLNENKVLTNKEEITELNGNNSVKSLSSQRNITSGLLNLSEIQTLDELNELLKATTKENIEELKGNNKFKTKNDSYEIRKFETQFVSGANEENGNLVWNALSSSKGHEFTFRVNYVLSGLKELPAGTVQITIPKQILRNREGALDDYYVMSLPTLKEWEERGKKTEFVYKEDGDYLVIYNVVEVEAGANGYFEISYATNSKTFNYKDYNPQNTNKVTNGGTGSDEFYAIIALNVGDDLLTTQSDDKNVFINTTATLETSQKRYPTIYEEWNSSWMETAPENSEKYYYLVWEIASYINNATQKYNFTLNDYVTSILPESVAQDDYELVGYKFAGERYYSNNNTVQNQVTNGYRYDYVLTRHKISTFDEITYKLKNTVTAIVDPIDQIDEDTKATSSNQFSWDPGFIPPTGHFNLFKNGNNTGFNGKYSNYDLEKMQNGEVDSLKNFKYKTETIGYAYPWTLKEGGSSNKFEDYGKNPVMYDTWDDTLNLEDDVEPMNSNDYYLDYFTYSIENAGVEYDKFYNKLNKKSAEYEDNEIITFYAKFGDRTQASGDEWKVIGTYNLKTKEIIKNDDYIEKFTNTEVKFKEGVHATGWRFTTSNKHYYTYIIVMPCYVLTASDYVIDKITDKSSIKLKNTVNTKITDYKGKIIFEKVEPAFDYARVTYYNSEISKKVVTVSNKVAEKKYTITWKVNAWENATSGEEGIAEYITQENGKFYDLIPIGGEIDVSSIQVETEAGFLDESEYSFEIIQNYKGSGRAMFIVTIDKQADFYNVYYTTVHSWESMKDYGKKVLNPVAYETGNEKIVNGFPDDGGNLSQENKELYNDLDKTTNDNKFLYTERTTNINAITATISGLYKKVKNSTESEYTYSTEVEPQEIYTYKLRFENTFINSAKNLVLFDSLENFKVIDSEAGTEKTSGWRGKLKSIDIAQLTRKGIDAKVYISTVENLDLEINHDLTNTSIWQLVTDSTDLSIAKALAIDMTKNIDGQDFVLASGDSITSVIYMEAPENQTEEILRNQYAYNNIYMQNTLIDELNQSVDYYIHQDYTTVRYRVVADVPFYKVNALNQNEGIKGITFRLYGKSEYGTEYDKYITSGENGRITFKSIEAGEYILQEYQANSDWLEDHTEHIVKINFDRSVYIDGIQVLKDYNIIITNTPRAHTDIVVVKKDLVNKYKVLVGTKFKLSGTSDYGNEVLMYAESDKSGKVTFENVEKGKYQLIEVSSIEGYILNDGNREIYRVIVDENSNFDIQKKKEESTQDEYESIYNNGKFEIYNEPYHSFNFIKKDLIDKNVTVKGATFKLTGISDYNTPVEMTAVSDEQGIVTFNGLEKGTYTLKEIKAADGYVLNTENYTVTIDKIGNFTISGNYMSKVTDGEYNIYNEPKHSFYFIKRDSYNNEKLGGAKFRLYGSSNIGNSYDETVVSVDSTGFVNFQNLESGIYLLKEIEAPNTDELSYILDDKVRVIEVFEDGKVTLDDKVIWPLELNENEPYIWYNKRNQGQVTVTKKWVDNLTNDERKEPKIYIATKKGELAYSKAYFRTADSTHSIIDYVTTDNITAFKRNITLSEQDVLSKSNVKRLDNNYENENVAYKIYGWVEDGTLYWWTKADKAVLPANLDYYFNNETSLKDISFAGIYKLGYWTGSVGSESINGSITNMKNMFYNCTSIENLDISVLNNSEITEKNNMEHLFGVNESTKEGTLTSLKYITIGENFKVFDTSLLPAGKWKNQKTNEVKRYTTLTGTIVTGTYEYEDLTTIIDGVDVSTLTSEEKVQLYGKTVNYGTDPNIKWRIFYIDEDGYFGDGKNAVYLKADITESTSLDENYIPTDNCLIEKMNPEWAKGIKYDGTQIQARGRNEDGSMPDEVVWNANEKSAAWLCDTEVWKERNEGKYFDESKGRYVIGTPSIEMFMKSYAKYVGNEVDAGYNYVHYYDIDNYGYQYKINDDYVDATVEARIQNILYFDENNTIWFASPCNKGINNVCGRRGKDILGSDSYNNEFYIWPLVCVRNDVSINTYKETNFKIGEYVDYSVTVKNGKQVPVETEGAVTLDKWRIFDNDGTNAKMIYAGYLPSAAIALEGENRLIGMVKGEGNYKVAGEVMAPDIVDILKDTSNWEYLITDKISGATVTGSASLAEVNASRSRSGLELGETIYDPYRLNLPISDAYVKGWWLTEKVGGNVLYIGHTNGTEASIQAYSGKTGQGIRPVITLPNDIVLERNIETGLYEIK